MAKLCLGWHTDCPYFLQDTRCAWFVTSGMNHIKAPKCGNPARSTTESQVDIIVSGIRKELINQKKIKEQNADILNLLRERQAQNEEILNLLREQNIKDER